MGTTTGARAASTFPAFQALGAGIVCAAYGSHDFAANPTAADIIEFCKVPRGATILGGWLRLEDIDSNATEEFDMDIGTATDPDAFGNFGVQTGDATLHLPEGGAFLHLHGTLGNGPVTVSADTVIQGVINVDAATFAAGTASLVVLYVNS